MLLIVLNVIVTLQYRQELVIKGPRIKGKNKISTAICPENRQISSCDYVGESYGTFVQEVLCNAIGKSESEYFQAIATCVPISMYITKVTTVPVKDTTSAVTSCSKNEEVSHCKVFSYKKFKININKSLSKCLTTTETKQSYYLQIICIEFVLKIIGEKYSGTPTIKCPKNYVVERCVCPAGCTKLYYNTTYCSFALKNRKTVSAYCVRNDQVKAYSSLSHKRDKSLDLFITGCSHSRNTDYSRDVRVLSLLDKFCYSKITFRGHVVVIYIIPKTRKLISKINVSGACGNDEILTKCYGINGNAYFDGKACRGKNIRVLYDCEKISTSDYFYRKQKPILTENLYMGMCPMEQTLVNCFNDNNKISNTFHVYNNKCYLSTNSIVLLLCKRTYFVEHIKPKSVNHTCPKHYSLAECYLNINNNKVTDSQLFIKNGKCIYAGNKNFEISWICVKNKHFVPKINYDFRKSETFIERPYAKFSVGMCNDGEKMTSCECYNNTLCYTAEKKRNTCAVTYKSDVRPIVSVYCEKTKYVVITNYTKNSLKCPRGHHMVYCNARSGVIYTKGSCIAYISTDKLTIKCRQFKDSYISYRSRLMDGNQESEACQPDQTLVTCFIENSNLRPTILKNSCHSPNKLYLTAICKRDHSIWVYSKVKYHHKWDPPSFVKVSCPENHKITDCRLVNDWNYNQAIIRANSCYVYSTSETIALKAKARCTKNWLKKIVYTSRSSTTKKLIASCPPLFSIYDCFLYKFEDYRQVYFSKTNLIKSDILIKKTPTTCTAESFQTPSILIGICDKIIIKKVFKKPHNNKAIISCPSNFPTLINCYCGSNPRCNAQGNTCTSIGSSATVICSSESNIMKSSLIERNYAHKFPMCPENTFPISCMTNFSNKISVPYLINGECKLKRFIYKIPKIAAESYVSTIYCQKISFDERNTEFHKIMLWDSFKKLSTVVGNTGTLSLIDCPKNTFIIDCTCFPFEGCPGVHINRQSCFSVSTDFKIRVYIYGYFKVSATCGIIRGFESKVVVRTSEVVLNEIPSIKCEGDETILSCLFDSLDNKPMKWNYAIQKESTCIVARNCTSPCKVGVICLSN